MLDAERGINTEVDVRGLVGPAAARREKRGVGRNGAPHQLVPKQLDRGRARIVGDPALYPSRNVKTEEREVRGLVSSCWGEKALTLSSNEKKNGTRVSDGKRFTLSRCAGKGEGSRPRARRRRSNGAAAAEGGISTVEGRK